MAVKQVLGATAAVGLTAGVGIATADQWVPLLTHLPIEIWGAAGLAGAVGAAMASAQIGKSLARRQWSVKPGVLAIGSGTFMANVAAPDQSHREQGGGNLRHISIDALPGPDYSDFLFFFWTGSSFSTVPIDSKTSARASLATVGNT